MRTTASQVCTLLGISEGSVDMTPFILSANELVTEVCAPVTTYTETRLELIERWLAAHFYRIYDPQAASENAKGVGASYFGRTDLGLDQTREGQQAKLLDTAGGLKRLDKGSGRVPSVSWLGTPEDEQ